MRLPELEKWFNEQELPQTAIISKWMIHNVRLFVLGHITTLKHNSGNKTYLPYYERLLELKSYLEKNK